MATVARTASHHERIDDVAAPMIGQPTFRPPLPPQYGGQQRHGWFHHHDDDRRGHRFHVGNSRFGMPGGFEPQATPCASSWGQVGQYGYAQPGYGQGGWTTTSVPRAWNSQAGYGYSTWAQPMVGFGAPAGYGYDPYAVPTAPWYVRIAAALFG